MPPPIPPSDYEMDAPPVIPPKPAPFSSVCGYSRSQYGKPAVPLAKFSERPRHINRVNSNPHGQSEKSVHLEEQRRTGKQLSRSHDPLPNFEPEEEEDICSHSLPEASIPRTGLSADNQAKFSQSIQDQTLLCGNYSASSDADNWSANFEEYREQEGYFGEQAVYGEQEEAKKELRGITEGQETRALPSNRGPLPVAVHSNCVRTKSITCDPDRPDKHESKPRESKTAQATKITNESVRQKKEDGGGTDAEGPVRSSFSSGQMEHGFVRCASNVFANAVYEPLYLAEEPPAVPKHGNGQRNLASDLKDDRRHSCPVHLVSEQEDTGLWNHIGSLDRQLLKHGANADGVRDNYNSKGPDQSRPVPLPPGMSKQQLQRRYSVENNEEKSPSSLNAEKKFQDNRFAPAQSQQANVDACTKALPQVPMKKRQSVKARSSPEATIQEHKEDREEGTNGAENDVYYLLPENIPVLSEVKASKDFFISAAAGEDEASSSTYESPIKVIKEERQQKVEGACGFDDDFSTVMITSLPRTNSDPFRNDDFFCQPQPAIKESPTKEADGHKKANSKQQSRSTKHVNGGESQIGRDEKLDSFVDQKTGKTMIAGPGRFFRLGQAVGSQQPIEFYEEDFNILMAQGYSKEHITRALVISENNFAMARKILKEFAAPKK